NPLAPVDKPLAPVDKSLALPVNKPDAPPVDESPAPPVEKPLAPPVNKEDAPPIDKSLAPPVEKPLAPFEKPLAPQFPTAPPNGDDGTNGDNEENACKVRQPKPGPLTASEEARLRDHIDNNNKFLDDFCTETGKSRHYVCERMNTAIKGGNKFSTWNYFEHRWSLENERGKDETGPEYMARCLAEYRATMASMSESEKAAFDAELLAWAEQYNKEDADDIVASGARYKVMGRTCERFEELGRPLKANYNLISFGFVICLDPMDASGMASNACWANDPALRKFLQERNIHVKEFCADVVRFMGGKGLFVAQKMDWSLSAFLAWKELGQLVQRDGFKDAFKHLQVILLANDAPSKAEWTRFEKAVFDRRLRIVGWPVGVALPSVGRDKYLQAQMEKLTRVLYRTFDAMEKGLDVESDSSLIRFEELSEKEREYEGNVEKRDQWFKVPIWKLADGTVVLHVEDFVGPKKGKKIEMLRKEATAKETAGKAEEEDRQLLVDNGEDEEGGAWLAPGKKKARAPKDYVEISEGEDQPSTKKTRAPSRAPSRAPAKRKRAAVDDKAEKPRAAGSKRHKPSNPRNPVGGGDVMDVDGVSNEIVPDSHLVSRSQSTAPLQQAISVQHAVPLVRTVPIQYAVPFQHAGPFQQAAPVQHAFAGASPLDDTSGTWASNRPWSNTPQLNELDEALGLGPRGTPYAAMQPSQLSDRGWGVPYLHGQLPGQLQLVPNSTPLYADAPPFGPEQQQHAAHQQYPGALQAFPAAFGLKFGLKFGYGG
ncbi:hypothetical protein AURDEDRAFT_161777, partial [Auricularia subglabra TFB-10046 SS5]